MLVYKGGQDEGKKTQNRGNTKMDTKLTKHKGTAEDAHGCQFHYACYTSRDRLRINERTYVCEEFPELRADTLKELKILLGNK